MGLWDPLQMAYLNGLLNRGDPNHLGFAWPLDAMNGR